MKWPRKNQWRQFFKVLTKKEKILFFLFFFLFFFSFLFLCRNFYLEKTKIVPKEGGEIVEGAVGFPQFINPVLAVSDVDRDLVELTFSGLMKYERGEIVPDLAKDYKILEDGKVYEFDLKENLFWSNGEKITADDVVFTVETIQNSNIKSPYLGNWLGVKAEKVSDSRVRFTLPAPSAVFLENCTQKIIQKSTWEKVSSQFFPLSPLNFSPPASSGPFLIDKIFRDQDGKINSLELKRNEKYHGKKPYLEKIIFKFFPNEEELIKNARINQVDAFSLKEKEDFLNFNLYRFPFSRYFAVFLNRNLKIFSEKGVCQALDFAVDKKEILEKVFAGNGKIVSSPLLTDQENFDLEKAKEILENLQFKDYDGDGFREKIVKESFKFKSDLKIGSKGEEVKKLQECLAKDKEIYPEGEVNGIFDRKTEEAVKRFQEKYKEEVLKPSGLEKGTGTVKGKTREKLNQICFPEEKILLSFFLVTVDQPKMKEMALLLKENWEKIGAKVEIKTIDLNELERTTIKKRDYDALLFGQILGKTKDLFPYWHSSQKGEMGLNLSNYENKEVDKLLEEEREELNQEKREEKLKKVESLIKDDCPAVFLVSPDYLYFAKEKIKGIETFLLFDPCQKFENVGDWYIKTKRVLK